MSKRIVVRYYPEFDLKEFIRLQSVLEYEKYSIIAVRHKNLISKKEKVIEYILEKINITNDYYTGSLVDQVED